MAEKPISEQMSLEEYKQKVEHYLKKNCVNTTGQQELMKEYENDFQEFYESNLSIPAVAMGMVMKLL